MRKVLLRGLPVGIALVFALSIVPAAVFATEGEGGDDDATTTTTTSEQEDESGDDHGTTLKDRLAELKEQRQANQQHRLEANKLRVCENRKQKVANIMTRAVTRAEKQLTLFGAIATRVEAFYVKKGKTVANYDELVAAIASAKAQAQADLDTLKTQTTFDCSADDPKGNIEAFKEALKTVNKDLKAYRTSVKNLIVAVKSAQSEGGEE